MTLAGSRAPSIDIVTIGAACEPVMIVDHFSPDPDALRADAIQRPFLPADNHYPGLRAELPDDYMRLQLDRIGAAMRSVFGVSAIDIVDARYAMVTTPPDRLSIGQRLPHVDAFGRERIAFVHFLSPDDDSGTAFYRHRSTEFETIDDTRAAIFFDQVEAEMRRGGVPDPAYIDGDSRLFDRIAHIPARYDRALIYRSYLLHSGAIPPDARLSSDPRDGRLTVTAFLSGRH